MNFFPSNLTKRGKLAKVELPRIRWNLLLFDIDNIMAETEDINTILARTMTFEENISTLKLQQVRMKSKAKGAQRWASLEDFYLVICLMVLPWSWGTVERHLNSTLFAPIGLKDHSAREEGRGDDS